MKIRKTGAQRRANILKKAGKIAGAIAGATPVGMYAKKIAGTKLSRNAKKMKRFVKKAGRVPAENLAELAVQTADVRDEQIQDIIDDNVNYPEAQDYESAEEIYEEQQEDGANEYEDGFDGENDYFTEDALSTILGTAKGVITKIKEGRLKKGKKFLGKTAEQWKAKQGKGLDVNVNRGGLALTGLTNDKADDVLSTAVASAKDEAIKDNLKRYLPIIIVVVVVVAIFGRKLFK